MPNYQKQIKLTIETLILVAVWENPFIFQGCFKVIESSEEKEVLFFFRCKSAHSEQMHLLQQDFSPWQYEFTHLYNKFGLIQLDNCEQLCEDALYLLKYSLHMTLREMLSSRKQHFISIDDVAMQLLIEKIKPILNESLALPEADHIGFAVAIDFCPKEESGNLAALFLLRNLSKPEAILSH